MSRPRGSKNRPKEVKIETQCEEVKALPSKSEALAEIRNDSNSQSQ